MELLDRLNKSIDYIEENLTEDIDYGALAQIACCSTFHFQRMFSYIAGVALSEYIRHRRMTAAAFELQSTDIKVVDIALKYGYESPTSFNRAFQSVHGISPSAARAEGVRLKAFPRISFRISIKGDSEMDYKIEKKDGFRIVGAKEHLTMNVQESFVRVPQFWEETVKKGMAEKICRLINKPPYGLLGISACVNENDFDYYIAAATDLPAPEGMSECEIPANTWAIFECVGPMPEAIQNLQKKIMTEWLPTSGYDYADAPDIEVYPEGDTKSETYKCEVWLPIIKKK